MAALPPAERRGVGPPKRELAGGDSAGRRPDHDTSIRQRMIDRGPPDAELVRRACGGDRWAEEAIYRRYVQYVASVPARVLRNQQDTDDIVQDTFISALEQIHALRDGGALRIWLARIAVNHVRRRLRRRKLLGLLGLDRAEQDVNWEEVADGQAAPDVAAELGLIERALAELPYEQRLAWVLHRVLEEPTEHVAEVLGCSLATSKRRLADAESRIARHVGHTEES
jgi:RNA polymerase sigma-70 factor, ECF subfamily